MNSAFQFLCRTKTAFGSHALFHLPFDLFGMNAHKPFVITDQAARDAGLDLQLVQAFQDAHVPLGITVLEDTSEMESLYHLFVDKGYDSIITLGPGMLVQTAKVLNLAICAGPEMLRSCAGPGICLVMDNLLFLVQNPGKEELLCQKAGKNRRQPLAHLAHAAALSGFIRSNVPDLKTVQAGLHAGEPSKPSRMMCPRTQI